MTVRAELFDEVETWITEAHLVAFDGCHKIYLAMDEIQAEWFRENYEINVEDTPEVMLNAVKEWYEESCFLRFVNAVEHNADNPNAGFTVLIEQGADRDDEDEEDY